MAYENGQQKAWGVRFRHPDRTNPSLRWIGEITVSDKGGPQIYFSNTLGISQTDERVAPVEVIPSNPGLNREILSELKGQTRHKHRLFSKPHVLNDDASSIELFIRIVENKDRSHPLVLITPGANDIPLIDPNTLARSLAGMAHILVAASYTTALQSSKALPPGLGCQNGGIRIYWPDFHKNKDPQCHDVFLDWEVLKFGEKLPGKLVELIARQAVLRMPDEYISWSELQTASLRQSIEHGHKAGDALELLAMFEAENSRLQEELTTANARIVRLQENLEQIRQQVAQLGVTLLHAGAEEAPATNEVSPEYEADNEDDSGQNTNSSTDSENDDDEASMEQANEENGLPFYNYDTYLSRLKYTERKATGKVW